MKILLIADPHIPVPPHHYGGAERVVHLYAQEMWRLGHTIHLLAAPGSRSYGGHLFTHLPAGPGLLSRARRKAQFQALSLWAARECDVVYNHGRSDYLGSLLATAKPLLHRFANPIRQQEIAVIESRMQRHAAFHCISENQRSAVTISAPTVVIPNPIDCQVYQPGYGDGGYLAFLGRLTRNKGVDVAIEVSRQTGKRLILAGNISTEEGGQDFFHDCVKPHIDGERISWIGPVSDSQKHALLAGAEALLFPIRWDEPFGIVMVEALACGTPVIATHRASCPEVIEHGCTGFLCSPSEPQVEAFSEAVHRLPELRRPDCRRSAETRFDVRVITPMVVDRLQQLAADC